MAGWAGIENRRGHGPARSERVDVFGNAVVGVGAPDGCADAPHSSPVRAMAMGSKDVAMSVARPDVIRAFTLVAFAILGACCMNLLVIDEGAMHPRWARQVGQGRVERFDRAAGGRSEMRDGCWYSLVDFSRVW